MRTTLLCLTGGYSLPAVFRLSGAVIPREPFDWVFMYVDVLVLMLFAFLLASWLLSAKDSK